MRADEMMAAGRVAGDVLGGGASTVQRMHRTIARRVFTAVGPVAAPVRVVHDGIADGVYGVVRGAHRAVPRAGSAVLARSRPRTAPAAADTRRGNAVLSAVNGMWGDTLARRHPALSLDMTVRTEAPGGGRVEVPVTPAGLAAAFPAATGRVAVFLHGLCESDASWSLGSRRHYGDDRTTYGTRLADDLGYTPVYLRYNTGLHISDNGRRLAALLDELTAAWPVPVEEIALVGHSMGGLVARSAAHYGQAGWTDRLRHVFCLGTPHLGAPLERGVSVAAWALGQVPETRPFADMLRVRSAGVKDLRYGALVEEDWRDADPDEFLRDRCGEVPFLPTAAYYFVGATLAAEPGGPLALLGDLLVQFPSAAGSGRRRRIPFELENGHHVGGIHHFDLLNHPAVYAQLRTWLSRPA